MKRVIAIAACGLSLAACSSMPSWMQFDVLSKSAPSTTSMQFESEPAGAEAKAPSRPAHRTDRHGAGAGAVAGPRASIALAAGALTEICPKRQDRRRTVAVLAGIP